ncbi:LEAF RUST 10 DISEASE-RESISTANCE LOCUS RECEPTOR-LIKE PROTEIN KINASE-like 2.4 [Ricinus communis]|nr:LEAF RUST 10 DISEASE-RESISTANCE LOCUS RECEPTOR-LIKE PROTEIN KINASE-like 2.4 [Ricinus communis]XP_015583301.1 LEAF RUST 10 DISEASE-RESISTANCE LOCUS RECEPTOR-LIKE PROTEIN KINASE-like 2.4 [Ricinus communis]|eukprot:XP_015583301.1 LEAF RUST 10 DISEASE-RESISTANCE LOCUS RECEPTOR-LIKE PROTEIN KINASE-like 2.4 isoform X2 [Ricinus communis]
MSFSFPNDYDKSQKDADDAFNKFTEQANSTMKWGVAESFVMGVVIIIAIVAIVYVIIDCLKKVGNAIPGYARIANIDIDKASKQESSDHMTIRVEPEVPVNQDSRIQFATVERFLSKIAREKPVRFSPQQIEEITNNCSKILGSGSYGVVFAGELPNGVLAAVKVLTNHSSNKKMEEQFMAEVSTIGRTYHVNLVRLYGFCFDPSMMALVYEYMENGSLNKFLFDERRETEWEKLHQIAIGTAKGIAYLHEECEQRIVHYDIKPENILLDDNFNPKVADFGLAKLCNRRESSKVALSGGRGTLGYSAPEVWDRNHPVTHKCDVYSFGILLFEIVARRRHFDANLSESRQWLPRWAWDMYKNNELGVMLALCGIEGKDKEKAEKMCSVGFLCIQDSPDARPLMSDVVKMLEGGVEIQHPPQNPFQYLESAAQNLALNSDSSIEDSSMSE